MGFLSKNRLFVIVVVCCSVLLTYVLVYQQYGQDSKQRLLSATKSINNINLISGSPRHQYLLQTEEINNLYIEISGDLNRCQRTSQGDEKAGMQAGDLSDMQIQFFSKEVLYHRVNPVEDIFFFEQLISNIEKYPSIAQGSKIEIKENMTSTEKELASQATTSFMLAFQLDCYLYYMKSL